jgi:sugar phosphate isomerase/epimerase
VTELTRRDFGKLALAGLAIPTLAGAQTVSGVKLGVQTYSFRDLPRTPGGDATDAIIASMTACGLSECELWAPQIEPAAPPAARGARPSADDQAKTREDLRKWRTETPLTYFQDIARKFKAAGHSIHAYNFSFNSPNLSDGEIDRAFDITKALGAEIITASTNLTMAKRVAPFAEKHKMVVAMHNHSQVDKPDEFAKPESFAAAMAMSKYFKVNLDIGHFTAANYDAVAYIREHHASITNLHLKDRKKNQGDNVPWGEGETPIREVLQLLKKERWPIPAYVEYEYRGAAGSVDEVKKCAAFARQALA